MVRNMNDLSTNYCTSKTLSLSNADEKNCKIYSLESEKSNKPSVRVGIPALFTLQRSIDEDTMHEFPDSQLSSSRSRLNSTENREVIEVGSIKKVSDAKAMFENMSVELKHRGNTPKHIAKALNLNTNEKNFNKVVSKNSIEDGMPMHAKTRSLPVDVMTKDLHNYAGTTLNYKNNRLYKDSVSDIQKSAYFDEKDDQEDVSNCTDINKSYDNNKSYHYKTTGNNNQLDQQLFPSYSTDDVRYDQKDKCKTTIKNDPADELRQAANRYHQELIKNYPKFRHSIFLNDNASKMSRKVSNQPENTFNRGEPTRATIASTSSNFKALSKSVSNSSELCDMNNLMLSNNSIMLSNNSIMGRLLNDESQGASVYKIDGANTRTFSNSSREDTPLVQSNRILTQAPKAQEPKVIQIKDTDDCSQVIDEKTTSELATNDTFMNRLDSITSIADSTKSSQYEGNQGLYFRSNSPACSQNLVSTNVYPIPNALYRHVETDIDSPEAEALIHQRALSSDSAVYLSENQHKCDLNNQYTSMSDLDIVSLKHSAQNDSDDINLLPPPPDDFLCDEITNETNIEREKPQRTINRKKNNYYGLNSRNNSCVSTDSTTSTGTADSGIGVRSDNSPSPISNDEYFLNKPLYGSQECLDDDVAELDIMPHSASTPDHRTDNYTYTDETDFNERNCSYNKTESTECLASGKKVNDLDGEKSKLIESMREKINELRLQEQEITDEIRVNDNLGKMVLNMVESKATQSEFSKFELFIGELNKIVALLLSLTQRLHRYELMLQELDMSNEEDKLKKEGLISKIAKLQSQLEEACYLKDVNNKRGDNVALFLEKYCTDDEISDYQYYIDMKSQLALMQSEIREKVKLGEERLSALERTGSEWEFNCQ
ncbi:uncharacterized protein LOC100204578 isoform X1 [Hydra vulgaris]|uniref:Uncharacterized protein LOC100204578 isoform X1 n=2 Tax=Hydra vulgaris TaxID=6087 RepID=A0ABM4D4H9_HYDVU